MREPTSTGEEPRSPPGRVRIYRRMRVVIRWLRDDEHRPIASPLSYSDCGAAAMLSLFNVYLPQTEYAARRLRSDNSC